MEIVIPTSFQVINQTYKVKQVKKVDKQDNRGEIDEEKKLIKIKRPNKDFPQDMTDEAFFHELIHAILDELEYGHLSRDEQFVERFSRGLHQALKTMK